MNKYEKDFKKLLKQDEYLTPDECEKKLTESFKKIGNYKMDKQKFKDGSTLFEFTSEDCPLFKTKTTSHNKTK